jgi:tRNA(fMet)-specific endonuclease VapC
LIVLDTDIISLLDRKSGEGFERFVHRFTAVPDDERVCATIISFEEQMRGWLGQVAAARKPKDEVTAYTAFSVCFENISEAWDCGKCSDLFVRN